MAQQRLRAEGVEKRGEHPKGHSKTPEQDGNPEELSRALSAMAAFSAGDTELAKQVLLEKKAKAEEDQERLVIKAKYGKPNPQHFPAAACQRSMAVGWKAKPLIVTEPTVDLASGKMTWRHLVQRWLGFAHLQTWYKEMTQAQLLNYSGT